MFLQVHDAALPASCIWLTKLYVKLLTLTLVEMPGYWLFRSSHLSQDLVYWLNVKIVPSLVSEDWRSHAFEEEAFY